jgi:hypothetical protein
MRQIATKHDIRRIKACLKNAGGENEADRFGGNANIN